MILITFGNHRDRIWQARSFTYKRLTGDVMRTFPNDTEIISIIKHGGAINALMIDQMAPRLALRVTKALRRVSKDILEQNAHLLRQQPKDAEDMDVFYLGEISKLLALIEVELPRLESAVQNTN
jgi:hypothetical protein